MTNPKREWEGKPKVYPKIRLNSDGEVMIPDN